MLEFTTSAYRCSVDSKFSQHWRISVYILVFISSYHSTIMGGKTPCFGEDSSSFGSVLLCFIKGKAFFHQCFICQSSKSVAFPPFFCPNFSRNFRAFSFFTHTFQLNYFSSSVSCTGADTNFLAVGFYVVKSYKICAENIRFKPL